MSRIRDVARATWAVTCNWARRNELALLMIGLPSAALVVLLIAEADLVTQKYPGVAFIKEHADFIFMALIVAWLPLVLYRVEVLKNLLEVYKTEVATSKTAAQEAQSSVTQATGRLTRIRDSLAALARVSDGMRGLWETASTDEQRRAVATVLDYCSRLGAAWGRYLWGERTGSQPVIRTVEDLCWRMGFDAYMGEELRSLTEHEEGSVSPTGPVLVTRYPAYLGLLTAMAETLVGHERPQSACLAFLCLADKLPVEFLMMGERHERIVEDCYVHEQLVQWREAFRHLAENRDIRFLRLFLASNDQDARKEYSVPREEALQAQMRWSVYCAQDDENLETGIDWQEYCQIQEASEGQAKLADEVRPRADKRFFLVSQDSDYDGQEVGLACPPRPLSQVLDQAHGGRITETALLVAMEQVTGEERDDAWGDDQRDPPTDIMVIGSVPLEQNGDQELRCDDMEPIFAVECQAKYPSSDTCVLAFYGADRLRQHIMPWCRLLQAKSHALPSS